jgi:hypothetical protein
MILYFRTLTSIFLSLLAISVFISCIAGIYTFSSDMPGFANAFKISLLFAVFGMVLFGFTGAFFWSVLFKFSNRFFNTDLKGHVFSSVLSMPISIATFYLFFSGGMSSSELFRLTMILVALILPVALLSLYFYKKSYLDSDGAYIEKN